MAGRRVISQAKVDGWEDRLTRAVIRAFTKQTQAARHTLALTAASKKPAAAALSGAALQNLWNDDSWSVAVDAELGQVAGDIEDEASTLAASAFDDQATWGFTPSGTMRAAIVATAVTSGAYIGKRLADAGTSADPTQAVTDVLATAPDILSAVVGAMAQATANGATADVADYVSDNPAYSDATQTWNAVGDDRTRTDHQDADGQEVGLGEAFTVGGEDLMFPGDPAGSDENTMNCRCWTTLDGIDTTTDYEQRLGVFDSPSGTVQQE